MMLKMHYFHTKNTKIFWGGGTAPSPDPTATGEGDTPSADPTPLGAFGASIYAPSARPRRLRRLDLSCTTFWNLPAPVSVTRVDCDETVERSVQIDIPYERTFSLVFWEEERLVGAAPSTWNFGLTGPRWSKIADFQPIIARSSSAVTRSKKVQLTLIGSPLRAFQWA